METIIIVIHVITSLLIVGLILLQQGKGADTGASFGSGASQTVFGSAGSGNFLTKSTTIAAIVFFVTSMTLAIYAKQNAGSGSIEGLPVVNPELLQSIEPRSDIPVAPGANDVQTGGDIPALPNNDNNQ